MRAIGRLRPTWLSPAAAGAFLLAFVAAYAFPLIIPLSAYTHNLITLAFIFMAAALAWNWLGGYAGQVSFGHAAMFGIGAYVTARLVLSTATPLPVAWLLGGVVAGVYALAWGHPTLRLRGPYFAIATIGVGEATRLVMTYWEGLTGGSSGLSLPIQPELKHALYWYGLYFLGLVVIASYVLRKSRIGLALLAIKSDVDAAGDVGVSATFYQDLVLLCSGVVVGIAGGFYASYFAFIEPLDVFGFDRSISFVLMGVIGGIGTILGPILGAMVFVILQQVLIASYPQLYLGLYGSLLILAILFEPLGITGLSLRLARRLGYRPRRDVATGILGSAAGTGRGVSVPAAED